MHPLSGRRERPPYGGWADMTPGDRCAISMPQFAHELHSLLDGAVRHLRLVAPDGERLDEAGRGHLLAATDGLARMAEVLGQAMEPGPAELDVLGNDAPLSRSIPLIIAAVEPAARDSDVALAWSISEEAASLPTGLLETIVINGLRNGIDAASELAGPGRVEVRVDTNGDDLQITVADNGTGVGADASAGEYRLGLDLCARVVSSLDGTMTLTNVPYGGGAVLAVRIPLVSCCRKGAA
ncbi:MAG: sensor histidine kinase [Planctomycetota bacterium]